jgi:hypothetical protein
MTVTTPPSSARTSSPIPFPFSSPSSSYSHQPYQNNTPSRPSSTIGTGTKRKQVKNACVNCQKACKKCDDQRPCSRCVKYGIEDGCINSQRKERKRKNQDESVATFPTTTTRIQLNLSSTRTREVVEAPVPMRLSSRNGIRPFPKALLESLQHEEYEEAHEVLDNYNCDHDSHDDLDHHHHHHHHQSVYISPQVTDEFKTLAKICSDLHTVLSKSPSQPPQVPLNYNYRPINPFMMMEHAELPRVSSSSSSSSSLSSSSPLPIIQRRSASPTQLQQMQQQIASQMLLKPSSPIYNSHLLHQHPQLRDIMNRTPPEEDQDQTKHS